VAHFRFDVTRFRIDVMHFLLDATRFRFDVTRARPQTAFCRPRLTGFCTRVLPASANQTLSRLRSGDRSP